MDKVKLRQITFDIKQATATLTVQTSLGPRDVSVSAAIGASEEGTILNCRRSLIDLLRDFGQTAEQMQDAMND